MELPDKKGKTMNRTILFFVPGIPRPAGSKRAFLNKKTGKPILTDSSGENGRQWRQDVKVFAREAMEGAPLTGPVSANFRFFFARPKCHYGTGKNTGRLKADAPSHPTGPPDVLKLARACEDALSGLVYRDDAQIVREELSKHYSDTGASGVEIEILEW